MLREIWNAWKAGFRIIWDNATRMIALNLLWLSVSWLILPLGPATLAAYWWIARGLRDEEEQVRGYSHFYKAVRRFAGRGLVWGAGWTLVLFLAFAGLRVWPQFLPPLGAAIVQIAWGYALVYLAAMQPYLLESLTVDERSWGESLKRAAWQVLANPLYSHAHLLIVVAGLALGARFVTLIPIVMVSLILAFFAAAAGECPWKYGEPRPRRESGRIEDVI